MGSFLFRNSKIYVTQKFILALVISLFLISGVKAQIVYHDLVPDVYVCMPLDGVANTCSAADAEEVFDIDMNGVQDFAIGSWYLKMGCANYGYGPWEVDYTLSFFQYTSNSALFAGNVVGTSNNQSIVRFNYGHVLDNSISYYSNNCAGTLYYGNFYTCFILLYEQKICYTNSYVYSGWGTGTGYIGFLIKINGGYHRGWMQIEVISNHEIIIKDYAYHTKRQKAIIAGSTVDIYAGINDNFESQIVLSQTDNLYNIELPTELVNKQYKIRVVDVVGRLVQEIPVNSNSIQFDINEPGIFFINLIGDKVNWNKKVVVR